MYDLLGLNSKTLKESAKWYALNGWPVVPLEPRDKRPLTSPPELMHGLKDATTSILQADEWWTRWPNANIGLRTGIAFDVLDLDGPAAQAKLAQVAPKYRHTGPIASTGKGYHLFYAVTGSKNHSGLFDTTIDFRGDNGYVVAPPSVHPSGHKYVWALGMPAGVLPDAPDWLKEALFPPKVERTTDPNDPRIRGLISREKDIVTQFTALYGDVRRVGDRYVLYCPFHQDDTASLVLYPDTNSFFCFGCGEYGDPLNVARWMRTGTLRRGGKEYAIPQ